MSPHPRSLQDPARLEALQKLGLMDSAADAAFDRLTDLAAQFLGVPVSVVSLVDDGRQFFKSAHGLTGWPAKERQTPLSHSFCQHVVTTDAPLVIDNAKDSSLVCENLATTEFGIRAYLGIPIHSPEGYVVGSFCAIDYKPRTWTQREIDMMNKLAQLVMNEITLREENRQRVLAEKKLQQVGALQQAVLDGTQMGIISTDGNGLITTFSKGAEKIFGYTRENCIGLVSLESFYLASEVAARAAELTAMTGSRVASGFNAIAFRASKGDVEEREWTLTRADRTKLPARIGLTALRDSHQTVTGYVAVVHDLSAQRTTELALRMSEDRLHHVLGQAECLVWEAKVTLTNDDWDWRITIHPSGLFHRLFGERHSTQGGLWYQFEIPEQEEMNARSRQAMRSGLKDYTQEFRLIRNGKVTWIRESVSIIATEAQQYWLVGVATDVTRIREMTAQLVQSEQQFRNAFEYAGIGMALVDLNGQWLSVNKTICEIVGYTETELMGKTFQELTHPEDLDRDLRHVQDLILGKTRFYHMEKRYIHRDGSIVWINLTASLVRDASDNPVHFVSQIEDITVRKQLELALQESEEHMRLFAEHAPAAVAMFDREMRYLVHSAQWLRDYNLEGQSIIGLSHYEVFPEIGEKWREIHQRCLAGSIETNPSESFQRPDGSLHWVSWRIQPWHSATGRIGGIVMFTENITQRKQMEENLAKVRDEAIAASRLKSEFLANMSHEIRTPMNGVIGMADLLMDTPLTTEQQQMSDVIRDSANSLLTIINDILDLSKIEAGKLTIEPEDFGLSELVEQTIALLKPRARARGLNLEFNLSNDLPVWCVGDSGRIRQVLVNLVSNAVKFTEQGEVSVHVSVVDASIPQKNKIRFEVRDTGIGISETERSRLFQPFNQADSSTTRKYGGTGLGLAISQQLVNLMNGRIGLESQPGRGSIFWFELELPTAEILESKPLSTQSPALPPSDDLSPPRQRILVAEDNVQNQIVIRLLLEKMGYDHEIVSDGVTAIERLTTGGFSAVLMDCQMHHLDGYEASRRIREGASGSQHAGIPIIALTAHAMASDREKCLAAGMDDYLSKPVRMDELQAAFHRLAVGKKPTATTFSSAAILAERVRPFDPEQLAYLDNLPGRNGGSLRDELIEMALSELPAEIAKLQDFVTRRSAIEVAMLAHRLSGSAANLGATQFREVLRQVEQHGQGEAWNELARILPKLTQEWQKVQKGLSQLQDMKST